MNKFLIDNLDSRNIISWMIICTRSKWLSGRQYWWHQLHWL